MSKFDQYLSSAGPMSAVPVGYGPEATFRLLQDLDALMDAKSVRKRPEEAVRLLRQAAEIALYSSYVSILAGAVLDRARLPESVLEKFVHPEVELALRSAMNDFAP